MKHILALFFSFSLISSCSLYQPAIATPELFSKTVSNSIIRNNMNDFLNLIMNSEDFDYMIDNTEFTDLEREKIVSTKFERLKILKEQNKLSFETISPKLEKYQYSKCCFEIKKDENEVEFISNLRIFLTSPEKNTLEIVFQRLTKSNRGWISIGTFSIE